MCIRDRPRRLAAWKAGARAPPSARATPEAATTATPPTALEADSGSVAEKWALQPLWWRQYCAAHTLS
eukprot:5582172-Alexandrium_andersonii.AAC.1